MNDAVTSQQSLTDDDAYEKAPLQFSATRLAELVRRAEEDQDRQVVVPVDLMHKLYMAYLGILEVYTEQTAARTLIDGQWFLCSARLSSAIAPIMDEHRRMQAEKDIDREIELMKANAAAGAACLGEGVITEARGNVEGSSPSIH